MATSPSHPNPRPTKKSWVISAWKDFTTLVLFLISCFLVGVFGYAPLLIPLAQDSRFSFLVMVILGSCLAFKAMENTAISLAGHQGIPTRQQTAWAPARVVILGLLLIPMGPQGSLLGRMAVYTMTWGQ